jgi:cell wall-associated NlpC family hydrolase
VNLCRESFLGVSYVYGGTSPSGFDCSGLVYYCYRHFGYRINRTAAALSYNGVSVSASNLQAGDIVLFTDGSGSYIGHCGIYIGGGSFIHAPHTGDVVKISSLSSSYFKEHYVGARRII